jgi:hypothetical protein
MSDEGPRWYKSEHERQAEIERLTAELAAAIADRDHYDNTRSLLSAELAAERAELQSIGEDFGVYAGEKHTAGIRRVLTNLRAELAAERERREDADEALTIAYMQGSADSKEEARAVIAKLREALGLARGALVSDHAKQIVEAIATIDAALKETKGGGDE